MWAYLDAHFFRSFGLVVSETNDITPTAPQYAAVQSRFSSCAIGQILTRTFVLFFLWSLGHVRDFQVFENEDLEVAIDQFARSLMSEIPPNFGLLMTDLSHSPLGFVAAPGAFLLPRQAALQAPFGQLSPFVFRNSGVIQVENLSVAAMQYVANASIPSPDQLLKLMFVEIGQLFEDFLARPWRWQIGVFEVEADVPTSGFTADDDGLGGGHFTVQFEAKRANRKPLGSDLNQTIANDFEQLAGDVNTVALTALLAAGRHGQAFGETLPSIHELNGSISKNLGGNFA